MGEPIEPWQEVLQRKREFILSSVGTDNVLLQRILDYLQSNKCINPDHVEVITNTNGIATRDRFRKMLDFASAGGKAAFYALCRAFGDFDTVQTMEIADSLQLALGTFSCDV